MSQGIRNFIRKSANQLVSASVTLVDCTDLAISVALGQKLHVRWLVPFTIGATGGYKFQVVAPTTSNYVNSLIVTDAVTPALIAATVQAASASFANALAVAGTHILQMETDIVASAAGTLKLQFACNSAANGITVLQGAVMDIIFL